MSPEQLETHLGGLAEVLRKAHEDYFRANLPPETTTREDAFLVSLGALKINWDGLMLAAEKTGIAVKVTV